MPCDWSGRVRCGLLLAGLHQRWPNLQAAGIGGPKMAAQGFEAWWPHHKLAVRWQVDSAVDRLNDPAVSPADKATARLDLARHMDELNRVDNVITRVEFDYQPTGDERYVGQAEPEDGFYRIFVLAGDERVNLLSVTGDDGSGYYGTGFELVVRRSA